MLKKWVIWNEYTESKKSKTIKWFIKGHKYSDGQGIKVGTSFFKEDGTRSKGPVLQEGSGECSPEKGKNLERVMPENAFWRHLSKATLCLIK